MFETSRQPDPLLFAAKIILRVTLIIILIAKIAMFGGVIWIGIMSITDPAALAAQFGAMFSKATPRQVVAALAMMTGAALLFLVLTHRFLRHLLDMVLSVEQGDPFIAENADRLTRMAWLTLAMQALAIAGRVGYSWMVTLSDKAPLVYDLSLSGILLALLLFILARVFREGALMRRELEGTI